MTGRVRRIVKSSHGKPAIYLVAREARQDDAPSKQALTSAMLARIAIVMAVCAFVAAHAWGIYKIETTLRAQQSPKNTATVFSE
jgi:hypothetical protein